MSPSPFNITPFDQQLSDFTHFADSGFPLGHLVSPGDTTAPVQPASLPGDIAGKVAGAVANAATGGAVSMLFSTRAVAFILGIILVIAGLFILGFQGAEKGVEIVAGSKQRATRLKESAAALAA